MNIEIQSAAQLKVKEYVFITDTNSKSLMTELNLTEKLADENLRIYL